MSKKELVFKVDDSIDAESVRLPEHTLLGCVLASAIEEATGYGQWIGENTANTRKRRQAEALRWIYSEAIHYSPQTGVSFRYVCEALSLDPAKVREVVCTDCDRIGRYMSQVKLRGKKRKKHLH